MVGTVWTVSCLLFHSRCLPAQPFVKVGARAHYALWSRRQLSAAVDSVLDSAALKRPHAGSQPQIIALGAQNRLKPAGRYREKNAYPFFCDKFRYSRTYYSLFFYNRSRKSAQSTVILLRWLSLN